MPKELEWNILLIPPPPESYLVMPSNYKKLRLEERRKIYAKTFAEARQALRNAERINRLAEKIDLKPDVNFLSYDYDILKVREKDKVTFAEDYVTALNYHSTVERAMGIDTIKKPSFSPNLYGKRLTITDLIKLFDTAETTIRRFIRSKYNESMGYAIISPKRGAFYIKNTFVNKVKGFFPRKTKSTASRQFSSALNISSPSKTL